LSTDDSSAVPYGYCECGCGQQTNIAQQTDTKRGYVRGEPVRYMTGHGGRREERQRIKVAAARYRHEWERERPDIPYGCCWCGCGANTNLIRESRTKLGKVVGEPEKYLLSHSQRLSPVDYIEESRGYDTPCWIWQLANTKGYGTCVLDGKRLYVHRINYERAKGPIPDGLMLHHKCEQTFCVNPEHLIPVTRVEHKRLHKEM
jgi:hypothetical protein